MGNETLINFVNIDSDDERGFDISVLARVKGPQINFMTLNRVEEAISHYKSEYKEWDADGCLKAAENQLKSEGYMVEFLYPNCNIII